MKEFDKVKPNQNYSRIICDAMKEWLVEHKDQTYKVEKISEDAVKLFKVDFWITSDLLVMAP